MNEPWQLLEGYFEDDLTAAEQSQLRDWLLADAEHVRLFVREAHLHRCLQLEARVHRHVADFAARLSESHSEPEKPTSGDHAHGADETSLIAFPEPVPRRNLWKPSPFLAVAAGVVLLLGFASWLFPQTTDLATLKLTAGMTVTIERGSDTFAGLDNLRLRPGDLIHTGTNGFATLSFAPENTSIQMRPSTELMLGLPPRAKRFALRQGTIQAQVARQRPLRPLLVRTPNAEARVVGTKFILTVTTNTTRLDVSEGKVRLTRSGDGALVDVSKDHYAIVAGSVELAALPQTGGLLREIWTNISGSEVNDLLYHPDYPNRPAHHDLLTVFEIPVIQTNNYACRLVGYIHPPVTGDYTFCIASGGFAALWLSRDEDPVNKVRIAAAFGGLPREWKPPDPDPQGHFQMPQSPKTRLVAGHRYFIQAVQKTDAGPCHLAVAWRIPGGELEVISGEFLSPFKGNK